MSVKKWNELRDYVIQGLIQAEAGEKHETERILRVTLEKMEELDKKYYKSTAT